MYTNLSFSLQGFKHYLNLYAFWDNYFSQDEIEKLQLYASTLEFSETHPDDFKKKLKYKSIGLIDETQWIFQKLKIISGIINDEFFRFDLAGFEQLDFVNYCRPGDCYHYHNGLVFDGTLANNSILTKKLFFTVLLSDPDEYTGGELELFTSDSIIVEQKLGRIIAYPSFITSKISPIKVGKRLSLDYYVYGNKFK